MSVVEGGLRKRRANYFVAVDRETVRNTGMSYRALGVLTFLLDLPDGWDVKSEVLAEAEGREGREAVRTALRELAEQGYYRIERRRGRDGRFSIGTAISETAVPEWIADWQEYGGKPVVVVQQSDGTFRVLHKDGSTSPDGFPAPSESAPPAASVEDATIDKGAGHTGNGFPGAGSPGAGSPDPGAPDSGSPGALRESEKGDREGRRHVTSTSARDVEGVDNSTDQHHPEPSSRERSAETAQELTTHRGLGSETLDHVDPDEVERTLLHLPDRLRPSLGEALRLRDLIGQRMQRGWTREEILIAVERRLRPGGTLENPCGLFAKVLVPLHEQPPRLVEDQPRRHLAVARPWCGHCDEDTRRPVDENGFPDFTQPRCAECEQLTFAQHMQRGAS